MKNQPTLAEHEIVSLLLKRDQNGFSYLYDNYAPAIYGIIKRMVSEKEHADEVLQDVFVKIWKNIVQFDPTKGRLYTWMINLARNTAIDYLRSKGFQNEQKNQSIPESVYNSKDHAIAPNIDHIGMKEVLLQLKHEWRELIDLAYFKGYTQQEIAEKLDMPLGTVKTRTRNALIELKSLLKDYS
ncbi:RNA polymerase sigma factor [Pedobacter sp. MW01-1-1]|uniref:RNA polymerase sigma factor n=1 Tax=Pedobacter sp. MW01-1-1 TaxID=3383027 RepID=UPI003FF131F4